MFADKAIGDVRAESEEDAFGAESEEDAFGAESEEDAFGAECGKWIGPIGLH